MVYSPRLSFGWNLSSVCGYMAIRMIAAKLASTPRPRMAQTEIFFLRFICNLRTIKKGVMATTQSVATWIDVPM